MEEILRIGITFYGITQSNGNYLYAKGKMMRESHGPFGAPDIEKGAVLSFRIISHGPFRQAQDLCIAVDDLSRLAAPMSGLTRLRHIIPAFSLCFMRGEP